MNPKLHFNTAERARNVLNFSRKVPLFSSIPPYFFGKLPHFRFAPASLSLAALKRERKNAMNHHIRVFHWHEIPKKRKKPLLAYRKTRIIYPKMGIAVPHESR